MQDYSYIDQTDGEQTVWIGAQVRKTALRPDALNQSL